MREGGEGNSETDPEDYTIVETNAKSVDPASVFHVIKDVLAFVLYMHQQIPCVFQDLAREFEMLQAEKCDLEMALTQNEIKASSRRQHMSKMRDIKRGIKRLEKLMHTITGLESALKLVITEIPDIEGVILVLGSSPIRPYHVYEFLFSNGYADFGSGMSDFAKSRMAEGLSRRAIRALISNGAGSDAYAGPTKLFLFVKAPSSFNQPLHFLPKRDFRYSKKVIPFRLQVKCRSQSLQRDFPDFSSQTGSSTSVGDNTSSDLIWFQCRHVVKGIAFKTSSEE